MTSDMLTTAIFDLDGVVTNTAHIHAQAWKTIFDDYLRLREERDQEPFHEFTHDVDYLAYVDGKLRYDGVRSFLESRGISLPSGEPSDPPENETICGLGNRKNLIFREILKKQGVNVTDSTVRFIQDLKKQGVRIGAASSSKNCKLILKTAGIQHLFETIVDGLVSEQLGLRGKPEADIFVAAARNLEAPPAQSVVVEDATSGVQAGRNGGFGLVLGIAQAGNETDLLRNGADVAVRDLSEITPAWIDRWFRRKPVPLFQTGNSRTSDTDTVRQEEALPGRITVNPCYGSTGESAFLSGKRLVFFLDYDGTLTPIVERPELAQLSQDMRTAIQKLSEKHTVAIVSGRMRQDVAKLVNIDGLFYAGSHGYDISGPGVSMVHRQAEEVIPTVSKLIRSLSKKLGTIQGLLIEEKKFSVAVHYRLVDEQYLPKITSVVEGALDGQSKFHLMRGKKVFEILPNIDWDKGRAVRWILEALHISWSEASVVYIGDDVTDEYAFRTVRTRGTGILVADKPRESAADFRLATTDEVKRLFEKIIASP